MNAPIYTDPIYEIRKLQSSRNFWRAAAISIFALLVIALLVIGTITEW